MLVNIVQNGKRLLVIWMDFNKKKMATTELKDVRIRNESAKILEHVTTATEVTTVNPELNIVVMNQYHLKANINQYKPTCINCLAGSTVLTFDRKVNYIIHRPAWKALIVRDQKFESLARLIPMTTFGMRDLTNLFLLIFWNGTCRWYQRQCNAF